MGGAVSAGDTNDELVDNLVEAEYIKTPKVEHVFHGVDRANYYLPSHRDMAYKDLAWKHGNLHISAPCIYAEVMESLLLKEGLSFLNLGSGTGYLSTLVGLILGPFGINHGVELHPDVIEYAEERLEEFLKFNEHFDLFDFCEPQFTCGNCLLLSSGSRLYDRVYCGAACPPEETQFIKKLVKIDGILVMPVEDQLVQFHRTGEATWECKNVLPVSFATLVRPGSTKTEDIFEPPESEVNSLQSICRYTVRKIIRKNLLKEQPDLAFIRPYGPKKSKKVSDCYAGSCAPRRMDDRMGRIVMRHHNFHHDLDPDDDDRNDVPRNQNRQLTTTEHCFEQFMSRFMANERNCRRERHYVQQMDTGEELPHMEEGHLDEEERDYTSSSDEIQDEDDEEAYEEQTECTDAGCEVPSISGTHMCLYTSASTPQTIPTLPETSSDWQKSASLSTSCTSGIGTSSSVDEHSDVDFTNELTPHQEVEEPDGEEAFDVPSCSTSTTRSERKFQGNGHARRTASGRCDDERNSSTSSSENRADEVIDTKMAASNNVHCPSGELRKQFLEKINQLPIPSSLRQYVAFYREVLV